MHLILCMELSKNFTVLKFQLTVLNKLSRNIYKTITKSQNPKDIIGGKIPKVLTSKFVKN